MNEEKSRVDMAPVSRRTFMIAGGAGLVFAKELAAQHKTKTDENCVFCKIVSGKLSAFKLWEDKNYMAFLDHKPIMPGHTLLIPKDHFDYLFDMPEKVYSEMMKKTRKLSAPIRTAMTSKRIGVIVEGFGVAHCHIHLVPINGGGELIKKGVVGVTEAEFSAVATKIKAAIGNGR